MEKDKNNIEAMGDINITSEKGDTRINRGKV